MYAAYLLLRLMMIIAEGFRMYGIAYFDHLTLDLLSIAFNSECANHRHPRHLIRHRQLQHLFVVSYANIVSIVPLSRSPQQKWCGKKQWTESEGQMSTQGMSRNTKQKQRNEEIINEETRPNVPATKEKRERKVLRLFTSVWYTRTGTRCIAYPISMYASHVRA